MKVSQEQLLINLQQKNRLLDFGVINVLEYLEIG